MSAIELIDTFLRSSGRLRRWSFLGCVIIACACLPGMAYLGLRMTQSAVPWFPLIGVLLVAGGAVALPWSLIALLAKRLHDVGLGMTHALWIVGLNLLWPWLLKTHPSYGVVTTIFVVGISGWVLFARGDAGSNRFGPPPEAPRPQYDPYWEPEWAS